MNKQIIKGKSNKTAGKLKKQFTDLTDETYETYQTDYDHFFAEGREEEMPGRLRKKLGISVEDTRSFIENYC